MDQVIKDLIKVTLLKWTGPTAIPYDRGSRPSSRSWAEKRSSLPSFADQMNSGDIGEGTGAIVPLSCSEDAISTEQLQCRRTTYLQKTR